MDIKYFTDSIRIRNTGNPFAGDDVFVEVKNGDDWVASYQTNSIGNDYAYTDANNAARSEMAARAKSA